MSKRSQIERTKPHHKGPKRPRRNPELDIALLRLGTRLLDAWVPQARSEQLLDETIQKVAAAHPKPPEPARVVNLKKGADGVYE